MKISITNLLGRRKKFNIVLLVAVLCLSVFLLSIATTKNPRNSKAAASIDTCPGNVCTISGSGTFNLNSAYENKDIIIDTSIVIVAGSHHFSSLTIRNSGVLTHAPLLADGLDFNTATPGNPLLPNGQAKKVDLVIDGDLTLESGGKIDVTGKGYPGGYATRIPNGAGGLVTTNDTAWAKKGSGPGGGLPLTHIATHEDGSVGGGGGYGGVGGAGRSNHEPENSTISGGASYPPLYLHNFAPEEFQFGSGGGGAANLNAGYGSYARGGNGGGRVSIQASKIFFADANSYIIANGEQGDNGADEKGWLSLGGGGSGGTIWLKLEVSNITSQFPPQAYGVGTAHAGTIDGDNGLQINVKANGAFSGVYEACGWGSCVNYEFPHDGGGGGGRIVIAANVAPGNPSIKKTLTPIQRPAGTSNIDFNPYSLQKDDLIEVELNVSNLASFSDTTISDDLLVTSDLSSRCVPQDGTWSIIPVPYSTTSNKIEWLTQANINGILDITYRCRVE